MRNTAQDKNSSLIPRDFIDPAWLRAHPDQDTASRISDSHPPYQWPHAVVEEPEAAVEEPEAADEQADEGAPRDLRQSSPIGADDYA